LGLRARQSTTLRNRHLVPEQASTADIEPTVGPAARGATRGPNVPAAAVVFVTDGTLVATYARQVPARLVRLLTRRSAPRETPAAVEPGVVHEEAVEAAVLEPPPVLRPAAIFHQVLVNPAEFVPAWLRSRPAAPAPASADAPKPAPTEHEILAGTATTDEPKPAKRTRQRKANGSPAPTRTRTKRVTKPAKDPPGGAT
jgi:hypothetical protein